MNILVTKEEYDKFKETYVIPKYSIEIEFFKEYLRIHKKSFEMSDQITTIMVDDIGRITISEFAIVCSAEMVKAICTQVDLSYTELIDNYAEHLKTL